jgi:hypothetical protein
MEACKGIKVGIKDMSEFIPKVYTITQFNIKIIKYETHTF